MEIRGIGPDVKGMKKSLQTPAVRLRQYVRGAVTSFS